MLNKKFLMIQYWKQKAKNWKVDLNPEVQYSVEDNGKV
jgi:hypothetical protein